MSNFNDKELTQLLKRANISESVREGFMAKRRTLLKEAEGMKNKAYMEEMEEEEVYEADCGDDLDEAVESLEDELDMLAEMEGLYDDDGDDLMSEQEDDDDEGLDLDAEMDAEMDDSEMDPDEDEADAEINVPEDLARSVIELADMLKGAMNLDDAPAEDMPMDEPLGDEDDMDMDMPEDDMDMPEDEEAQLQEMVSRIVNRVAQRLIKESKKA